MSKVPARNMNYSIGGVAIECYINNLSRDNTQEIIVTTGFCDSGPRRTVGNADWGTSIDGPNDFASGSVDATLFGLIGDADGAATIFQPTGNAAGANDPNYTGSEVLDSYSIKGGLGQLVSYSAKLSGSTAQTRAVA